MERTAAQASLADRKVSVETPEHVAIGYDLADLGSRFAALLADGTIIGLGLIALLIGVRTLIVRLGVPRGPLIGWGLALVLVLLFLLTWGYFVLFEGLGDGQTPGKRLLGIRVVHDGGFPLTLRGAAIRNLLRLIDIQPLPSWLLGGAVMMLHPRTKRLGDIAAGSIVVRERAVRMLPEAQAEAVAVGPPRLDDAALDALARYVARRDGLRPEVRTRIAGELRRRFEARLGAEATTGDEPADAFLVRLHAEELARRAAAAGAAAAGTAQAAALVRQQQGTWALYRELLAQARRRGVARLPERDVSRFAALYREVAADLARARSYRASEPVVYSLERWVGAGHNLLYRPGRRSWRALRAWLAGGFPALVRMRWRPILAAAAILYLPAILAFAVVARDPTREMDLLPAAMIARAEAAPQREAEGRGYVEVPDVVMPLMASGIIANNVQVTFSAFAGGILAGIGTFFVLVFNGVHLGAVAAAFANRGASLHLWTFVLPHGVIELTAICIAGGAGLWLGSALLLPGRRTRRDALVERAREAISLLAGTVMLLVVAGVIEGFISPAPIGRAVKLAFAAVFAVLLGLYLLVAGRAEADRRRAQEAGQGPSSD
jgi:uncharacterized membrane protein SpoIIM required for sporulation/uncharacterized RDD family membrane protein YckC